MNNKNWPPSQDFETVPVGTMAELERLRMVAAHKDGEHSSAESYGQKMQVRAYDLEKELKKCQAAFYTQQEEVADLKEDNDQLSHIVAVAGNAKHYAKKLANIQAQAVEEAADSLCENANAHAGNSRDSCWRMISQLRQYASQIRAGAEESNNGN